MLPVRAKLLFNELELGPPAIPGGVGEARHFTAEEASSSFFVVMWRLKWLPDYVTGNSPGQSWWRDDEVAFSEEGGVRPTTILCDWAATTGAVLYDRAWLTERGLADALLVHTKRIVQNPADFSLPGWISVQRALLFLKASAAQGGVREGPLRIFLKAAGVMF